MAARRRSSSDDPSVLRIVDDDDLHRTGVGLRHDGLERVADAPGPVVHGHDEADANRRASAHRDHFRIHLFELRAHHPVPVLGPHATGGFEGGLTPRRWGSEHALDGVGQCICIAEGDHLTAARARNYLPAPRVVRDDDGRAGEQRFEGHESENLVLRWID